MNCVRCGHHWKKIVVRSEIVNEVLDVKKIRKLDSLTRAKIGVVSKFSRLRGSLLDFGAGSGKFLSFESRRFNLVEGVEINPECIEFARDLLGVSLMSAVPSGRKFDVVTAWHSLEHVPPHQLLRLTEDLHNSVKETLIVSVPNANSWVYRYFRGHYAFFDETSHHHQFTPHSIKALLKKVGCINASFFQIGIYSTFCYAQTLVNAFTRTHNILYYALKRGESGAIKSKSLAAFHMLLFVVAMPVALVLTLLEKINLDQAACLNIVCRKSPAV